MLCILCVQTVFICRWKGEKVDWVGMQLVDEIIVFDGNNPFIGYRIAISLN